MHKEAYHHVQILISMLLTIYQRAWWSLASPKTQSPSHPICSQLCALSTKELLSAKLYDLFIMCKRVILLFMTTLPTCCCAQGSPCTLLAEEDAILWPLIWFATVEKPDPLLMPLAMQELDPLACLSHKISSYPTMQHCTHQMTCCWACPSECHHTACTYGGTTMQQMACYSGTAIAFSTTLSCNQA